MHTDVVRATHGQSAGSMYVCVAGAESRKGEGKNKDPQSAQSARRYQSSSFISTARLHLVESGETNVAIRSLPTMTHHAIFESGM